MVKKTTTTSTIWVRCEMRIDFTFVHSGVNLTAKSGSRGSLRGVFRFTSVFHFQVTV